MAPNNFQKEERFSYPNGPLPDGYLFKLFAFRPKFARVQIYTHNGCNFRPEVVPRDRSPRDLSRSYNKNNFSKPNDPSVEIDHSDGVQES